MQLYDSNGAPSVMLLLKSNKLEETFAPNGFFRRFHKVCELEKVESGIKVRVQLGQVDYISGGIVIIPRMIIPKILKLEPVTELDHLILRKLGEVDF